MAQDQCILSITTRKRNSKDAPNLFIINNLANYSLVPGPSNQGSFQMFTFVPQPIRRRSPSSNSSLTQQILLQDCSLTFLSILVEFLCFGCGLKS
ncbi:hypothetical protein V6Z12_A06G059500 [Gossypium hirsutum]|uniref:Uncharacterized protein isoform X3 n=1 Tax=Gossypium hirsutum TaxID=3635 RepID=A0ABM3BVC9_GOSHI|nr:uncharacterized protein LOC107962561 isoform X3 [Gossypium hirsutum]